MATPSAFVQRLLSLRVVFIINLVVLFFLSLSFGREYLRNHAIEREISALRDQKAALESRNSELLSLGQSVQTQYFLEKEGRLKFGLRKPEETVVILPEQANTAPALMVTSDGQQAVGQPQNPVVTHSAQENRRQWFAYFFDHE